MIVVDNASPDRSLEAVGDLPITAVELETNRGFAHGCNVGWRRGRGEYVLFLNPDARIDPSSLRPPRADPRRGSASGVVGPADRRRARQSSSTRSGAFRASHRRIAQALFLHRVWPSRTGRRGRARDAARYDVPEPAEWLSGACLLVRRSLLEQMDGFDEGFFMYCEDKDLCRRAWARRVRGAVRTHRQRLSMSAAAADRGLAENSCPCSPRVAFATRGSMLSR